MPTTDSTQSAGEPNLPGSEVAQSNPNSSTNSQSSFNPKSRDSELYGALVEAGKPKEKRSEVPSTPEKSNSAQERKDNPADPQPEVRQQETDTTEQQQPAQPQTPEEIRREEQSFKDRYYDLTREREREKLEREGFQERERINQMSRAEQEAHHRFKADVAPLEQQAWDAHNAAQDLDERGKNALADGDRELADYFFQQRDRFIASRDAMSGAVRRQYEGFNQAVAQHRQGIHQERLTVQDKQISRTLTKAGLTLDDLKAVNPKLDTSDNFAVIEAVATAKDAKHKAEMKAVTEKAALVEKEAKNKWRTDSPAARPDRVTVGGGSSPRTNRGGPGSGLADIAEALSHGRTRR